MKILVTVGSTLFDSLISTVSSLEFRKVAASLGFTHITLQIGSGKQPKSDQVTGVVLDYFRFTDDLKPFMLAANVIICHAGAGTILEALRLPPLANTYGNTGSTSSSAALPPSLPTKRSIITVVNESLMDNHQHELASQLAAMGFINNSSLDRLSHSLKQIFPRKNRSNSLSFQSTESLNRHTAAVAYDDDDGNGTLEPVANAQFPERDVSLLPFLLDSEMGF